MRTYGDGSRYMQHATMFSIESIASALQEDKVFMKVPNEGKYVQGSDYTARKPRDDLPNLRRYFDVFAGKRPNCGDDDAPTLVLDGHMRPAINITDEPVRVTAGRWSIPSPSGQACWTQDELKFYHMIAPRTAPQPTMA